jgi:hypothetical protein
MCGELNVIADWLQFYAAGLRLLTGDAPRESVLTAVRRDPDLSPDQRVALEELYQAFSGVTRRHRRISSLTRS